MNPIVILGLLLALSFAGNLWLFHDRDKSIMAVATAKQLNTDTKTAAATCTASIDGLAKDSKIRHKALADAIGLTGVRVAELQGQANQALQAKPDDPKNLCASLERYLKARIVEERAGSTDKGGKP